MKRIKISIVLNTLIVLLVTVGCIFMFLGIKFMPTVPLLESASKEMFKYYTVDSNILIGIISLLLLIYEILLLKHKIKAIPNYVYILKQIGVSAILLTFMTTLVFLSPRYGFYAMYNNNNLFFHLIVPLLAVISYIFLENHDNKYKYAPLGILPMAIYSVYYISMVVIHLSDGGLTIKYDFYGFLNGNINNAYIVVPIIYLTSLLMSCLIIFLNKKLSK